MGQDYPGLHSSTDASLIVFYVGGVASSLILCGCTRTPQMMSDFQGCV